VDRWGFEPFAAWRYHPQLPFFIQRRFLLLNATTLKMLQILSLERLDVSTIAKKLRLSEAYISEQVTLLEKLKLIKVNYESGRRGIRKICEATINTITIVIKSKT
jgi:predicted transcriptional regulator